MAKNSLTPSQDLLTREFFLMVQGTSYLSTSPAHRRQLLAILLEALNYDQVAPNTFIEKGLPRTVPFGKKASEVYKDEWEDDEAAARAALYGPDSDEADRSKPSEDTEVREAVLREDV